jgi:hypothetical protein
VTDHILKKIPVSLPWRSLSMGQGKQERGCLQNLLLSHFGFYIGGGQRVAAAQ